MSFNFQKSRQYLQEFDFEKLFREVLGWSNPPSRKVEAMEVDGIEFDRVMIAELSGVVVYEIRGAQVPSKTIRQQVYREVVKERLENLLIFVDSDRTQSCWYWVKREDKKQIPRDLSYYKGQSGDLILGKISALLVDFAELENGDLSVVQVAQKLRSALDVEQVTKKFYGEFKVHLEWFVLQIQGIAKESDRRWYASIILNRLMFIYFLEYKNFVDGNQEYLQDKLEQFEDKDFYHDFLRVLFFEGFAKAAPNRSKKADELLGNIKYLNGGLFTKHRIEKDYSIAISNEAFERTFKLFQSYTWNLDDTPGGNDDEINPSVLGYIFEKYINQKEFGAYYTRTEITEYLCDRTINKLILDKINAESKRQFESIEELLFNLDADLCIRLLEDVLPSLSLLDPACGSGAFLVAAMKTLINVYEAVIGKAEMSNDRTLRSWLKQVRDEHKSTAYFIKKRIITDNLYGVDIMEEATEIAKLRLFLALVASAQSLEELEPLPNIDFNVMAGNSLIGLIRVDEDGFNELDGMAMEPTQRKLLEPTVIQGSLTALMAANEYRRILEEKNKSIALFKQQAFRADDSTEPEIKTDMLKASIDELNGKSQTKLNRLLFDEFGRLKIRFEQAQAIGKPQKRLLEMKDIDRLEPFHWGYHFDQIINDRGGFDAIITNPPWEVFQTDEKEFFQRYDSLIRKNKIDIKSWDKQKEQFLQDSEIQADWLEYCSKFSYVSAYFKRSEQYKNQRSEVKGKSVSKKINLYALFIELCFNLLKPSGECGIVVPSGVYTDLGCKQLREMLFVQTKVTGLFCFENRKMIFEGVDSRFKFVVLTFEKANITKEFPAAFMRQNVEDLTSFPHSDDISINIELVRRLSPDSLALIEFKDEIEFHIVEKMAYYPPLGNSKDGEWDVSFSQEINMTSDKRMFKDDSGVTYTPLIQGGIFHQFTHEHSKPKYWIDLQEGRSSVLGKTPDKGQILPYQNYRLVHRRIARNTDQRTLISTVLPRNRFCADTAQTVRTNLDPDTTLFLVALLNSFVVDFSIRKRVTTHVDMHFMYTLCIPRLTKGDRFFAEIVERAAKLICTTPEFDDLAAEVGLGNHTSGITDEADRAILRAELDGMIAHLYHLTEAEFAHILSTFPIVPPATKTAALDAYRQYAPPTGDQSIAHLIQQGESATLEFKSTARWNLKESKKDPTMEEIILKTIAAFLNSQGGTLLIGVDDSGQAIGLAPDYRTCKADKQNRDGFELWLMGDLLLKTLGNDLAGSIAISFHILNGQEICKVTVSPSPREVFLTLKDKTGQPKKSFFIRAGNSSRSLDDPSEMVSYIRDRWAT